MSSESPTPSGLLPSWLHDRLDNYFGKWALVQHAAYYSIAHPLAAGPHQQLADTANTLTDYLRTLWASLRQGHLSALFGQRNHELKDHAFAEFYQDVSQDFADFESTTAVPALVASAHGLVLELGPGSGNQLARFDAARIAHVYGVEPNTAFAGAFAARLRGTKVGIDGKYTLVPCGIEDAGTLEGFGLRAGSVDCVVCMQVMCSLPDLEERIRDVYRLLKPGGKLIFWEHCRSTDRMTRAVQWIWCLLWPNLIGGCRLDRVTREALLQAADWEVVDIHEDCEAHMLMPRLWGRLVKPKAT